MAKYEVTAPDGHTLIVDGPEGASHEEVLAQAQKLYQPKASSREGSLSDLMTTAAIKTGENAPSTKIAQGLEALGIAPEGTGDFAKSYATGLTGALGKGVTGVRQFYNHLTDPAEEQQLAGDVDVARKRLEDATASSPLAGEAGNVVGTVGPYLLGGELAAPTLAARLPAALTGLGGRLVLGAGGGAASGAVAPQGTEGLANDQRTKDEIAGAIGGTFGAAVGPAISRTFNAARNFKNRMLPEQALPDFVKRYFGATPTDDTITPLRAAYHDLSLKRSNLDKSFGDEFSANAGEVPEGMTTQPGVDVSSDMFSPTPHTFEDVVRQAHPDIRKVAAASAVLPGKTINRAVEYGTALRAMQKLNAEARLAGDAPEGRLFAAQARDIEGRIQSAADKDPELAKLFGGYRDVAGRYKDEYLPLSEGAPDRPLANWLNQQGVRPAFNAEFGEKSSGANLRELIKALPQHEVALKKILATDKLLGGHGEAKNMLQPSTLLEALTPDKTARGYALRLGKKLRETKDDTGLPMALKKIGRMVDWGTGGTGEKLLRGMQPYGTIPTKRGRDLLLLDALRGSAAMSANSRGE